MTLRRSRSGRAGWLAASVLMTVSALFSSIATASAQEAYQAISGSGSSWAYNAIDIWDAQVQSQGMNVNFTSSSSGQGRADFGNSSTDFADSDIGYLGKDPVNGNPDLNCPTGSSTNCRDYAYLPVVGGGTSFPYNLVVAGQRVENLRLSGRSLAEIFTGGISNWDDPAITADNTGQALPSIPIIPVVHTEQAGSTYQFTAYLNAQFPQIWQPFLGSPNPTEYFPTNLPGAHPESGSDSAMAFLTSSAANGAIGYDEYSYPIGKKFPAAKIENAAGFYTLPTPYNDAVALQQAQIDTTDVNDPSKYLLQNLTNVYSDPDPRAYPVSSYSYMIIPTSSSDQKLNKSKAQTLADYLDYSVCQGQKLVGAVGYSALPQNLVQASFDQIAKLQTAYPTISLSQHELKDCGNPTFDASNLALNLLTQEDPPPPACDQSGAGPCVGPGDSGTHGIPTTSATAVPVASPSAAPSTGPTYTITTDPKTGKKQKILKPATVSKTVVNTKPTTAAPAAVASGTRAVLGTVRGTTRPVVSSSGHVVKKVDPVTGQETDTVVGGSSTVDDTGIVASPRPSPIELAARQEDLNGVLAPLAVLAALAVLVLPPMLYFGAFRRRRNQR